MEMINKGSLTNGKRGIVPVCLLVLLFFGLWVVKGEPGQPKTMGGQQEYAIQSPPGVEYDGAGNIIKITSQGEVTSYDYDALGRVTCKNCHPEATGVPEFFEYDDNDNVVSFQTGEIKFYQEFDEQNRLLRIKNWEGGSATYSYDQNGDVAARADQGFFGQSQDYSFCDLIGGKRYDEDCNGVLTSQEFAGVAAGWVDNRVEFIDIVKALGIT